MRYSKGLTWLSWQVWIRLMKISPILAPLRDKVIANIPFIGIFMCNKKESQVNEEIPVGKKTDTGMRGRVSRATGEASSVARAAAGDGRGHAGVIGRQGPHCRRGVWLGTFDGQTRTQGVAGGHCLRQ